MEKPKSTFCRGYVNNKIWDADLANEWGYIPISRSLIAVAKNIVYEKGAELAKINLQDRGFKSIDDYLFQGNLVRINFFRTSKPAPLCGPDIELHSETKKGLEKLVKDLGFPEIKKM